MFNLCVIPCLEDTSLLLAKSSRPNQLIPLVLVPFYQKRWAGGATKNVPIMFLLLVALLELGGLVVSLYD
jgi:hypothetical protein